jgi:2-phosphosulfolactate phosphatase
LRTRKLQVFEKPADAVGHSLQHSSAAIIDVLRATSTIITALKNGCRGVIPAAEIEEALAIRQRINDHVPVLSGERQGRKIPGFELGNSPLEFSRDVVYNRLVIMTTTNGTRTLLAAGAAEKKYVLSLLNLKATAAAMLRDEQDISILCAGTDGGNSLEDSVCAGLLIAELLDSSEQFDANDQVLALRKLGLSHKNNLVNMFTAGAHGRYLQEIGFAADLDYCAGLNKIPLCALFENDVILLSKFDPV